LDYKRKLNLDEAGKKLDFIKDCAAMMNLPRGGYSVIGAEDDGSPARNVAVPPSKEMFDSAWLTQTVKSHVDDAVDIRAQVHGINLDGTPTSMALIYIAPPFDGIPAVMSKNGVVSGDKGNRPVLPPEDGFHPGGNHQRAGTSPQLVPGASEPARIATVRGAPRRGLLDSPCCSNDGPRVEIRCRYTGHRDGFFRFCRGCTGHSGRRAGAGHQTGPGPSERCVPATGTDRGARTHALNRITAIACEHVLTGGNSVVSAVVETLLELYRDELVAPNSTSGKANADVPLAGHHSARPGSRRDDIRERKLDSVPGLVLRPIGDSDYSYPSWIRHTLTLASRLGLLSNSDGTARGGALIASVLDLLAITPELCQDLS
jgi:hypothetical protein